MTSTATTSNPFPDVSPPPDTTYLPDPWFDEDGERRFWGTDRDGVMISGYQKADGHVRARRRSSMHGKPHRPNPRLDRYRPALTLVGAG